MKSLRKKEEISSKQSKERWDVSAGVIETVLKKREKEKNWKLTNRISQLGKVSNRE